MTTLDYILAGIAIGGAQAAIILIAWRRGYSAAMHGTKQRMTLLLASLQDRK